MPDTCTQRTATIDDLIQRLTNTPYEWTAVTALGWGLGPAQLGIEEAVEHAVAAGYLTSSLRNGKQFVQLAPLFTLTYDTDLGPQRREKRPARAVDTVGRVLMRLADRVAAWNIAVVDADGVDVTDQFACFQDPAPEPTVSVRDEPLLVGGLDDPSDHYGM